MKVANRRICSVCGNGLSGGLKFCPVCMLSMGVKGEIELEEASREVVRSASASEAASQRFEHYEVLVSEDGKPIELGRGAMGVTYKAFDVDLHCPVTLKVIAERKDHRPWAGEARIRRPCRSCDFNSRSFCRYTRVR